MQPRTTRTEADAFNALCRLIGERRATDETEDMERTATEVLAELEAAAAENGETVKTFADRLYFA